MCRYASDKRCADFSQKKCTNEICDMWKDYFMSLYNSVPDQGARVAFEHKCLSVQDGNPRYTVSVYDVIDAVSKQSKGKCWA